MKILGITGGIGSGKSEALRILEEMGGLVISCDKTAAAMQAPGGICFDEIVKTFGPEILNDEGELNRSLLGSIVFNDPDKLNTLNQIIHPRVKDEILRLVEEAEKEGTHPFAAIESAILIESGYANLCHQVWYIYAPVSVRMERLLSTRDISEEKINSIMKSQSDERFFRFFCDAVIDNSGDDPEMMRETIKKELEENGFLHHSQRQQR